MSKKMFVILGKTDLKAKTEKGNCHIWTWDDQITGSNQKNLNKEQLETYEKAKILLSQLKFLEAEEILIKGGFKITSFG